MTIDVNSLYERVALSKGQATQLRIIESALKLFSQFGFAEVTLQMIAKDSKTSHPLILKHFESKENLLLHVRKFVTISNHTWVDSRIKPQMNARERLMAHAFENMSWGFHNPEQAKIILLIYYYDSLVDPKRPRAKGARSLATQRILEYVMQAKREGLLKTKEKPEFVAEYIHEYLMGLFNHLLTSEALTKKSLPTSVKKKIQFFYDFFLKNKA